MFSKQVHQSASSNYLISAIWIPFDPAGTPATLGAQTPGLSPHFTQPPLLTFSLKKRRLSTAYQHTVSLLGISFSKDSLRKHLWGARLLEVLLVICNLTLFTATPKTSWCSSNLNPAALMKCWPWSKKSSETFKTVLTQYFSNFKVHKSPKDLVKKASSDLWVRVRLIVYISNQYHTRITLIKEPGKGPSFKRRAISTPSIEKTHLKYMRMSLEEGNKQI